MYERAGFRHERESEQWVRTATLTYGDARPGGKELEINRNSHRPIHVAHRLLPWLGAAAEFRFLG